MKLILLLCCLTFWAAGFAQPGRIEDSIMSVKGTWAKAPNTYPVTGQRSLFPVMEKKVDSIARLFNLAYPNLKGVDGAWYASLGEKPVLPAGPLAYAYRASFKYYYYNTAYRKIMKSDETVTWAYALVNRIEWLFEGLEFWASIDDKKYKIWKYPREKGEWKGHTLYAPSAHTRDASAVILTKKGRVPWMPLTQLQYLQALRKTYEAELAKLRDADKNNFGGFWYKAIKVIDDYVQTNSAAKLSQQAVVNNWRIFNGSFPAIEKDKYAYPLVYIDESYFNNTLPGYTPQFIVLYWRWNDNEPGKYFKEQIESNFPVDKLQAMISQQ